MPGAVTSPAMVPVHAALRSMPTWVSLSVLTSDQVSVAASPCAGEQRTTQRSIDRDGCSGLWHGMQGWLVIGTHERTVRQAVLLRSHLLTCSRRCTKPGCSNSWNYFAT